MINIEATIRWKGYAPDDLSHGSSKRVWANCEKCGDGRWVEMKQYRDYCKSCSNKIKFDDPSVQAKMSLSHLKRYEDPLERKKDSIVVKKAYKDNPTLGTQASDRMAMFRSLNPKVWDLARENQRGGNDICNHHYIYDESDLSKYTMKMTRSAHARLHWLMRKSGIIVPHINIKEVL